MYYLDTSVLVTMLTVEPETEAVGELVAAKKNLFISDWVITEFSSALSDKCRFGSLREEERLEALVAFARIVDTSIVVLSVTRAMFAAAARLCDDPEIALRSGDALHLAIAREHHLAVITRDRVLTSAAATVGIATEFLRDVTR